jgi:hypothetical protein
MERREASRILGALAAGTLIALAGLLAACGGGDKQDANAPSGTWKLDVISASFPGKQRLGEQTTLRIEVRNAENRKLPNMAVTIDGFDQRRDDPTLADPKRPIWIVNQPPFDAASALTNTWAIGPVAGGQTRTFTWNVTAVRAGTYSLRYKVGAGLYGKAKAELPDGSPAKGSFIARVSKTPRPATIGVGSQFERKGGGPGKG